ncbi:MAG: hypothetical protein DVB32_11290 [Verrucomicrobia bacterium]|nr:MAG: hypothetical protein DVB32_11290 [Verrucomicrobiota bacterium]
MARQIHSDPTAFLKLESHVQQYEATGRTESAAFLIWFLQAIYRLDDVEAQDAVCDRKGDLGFDALTVNDGSQEIVVFQAKRKEKTPATLGDSDLKKFVGALKHFETKETVDEAVQASTNPELKRLLTTNKVSEKIGSGYSVRPIFISNITADQSAASYLRTVSATGVHIDLWDLQRITPVLKQLEKEWFVVEPFKLRLAKGKYFLNGPKNNPSLVFASVSARELVRLPGIDDTRVFAQNVRLGLGRTRVNNEILETIKTKKEHSKFLTFHNGLTIVAQHMRLHQNCLHLDKYSVCNGCQSLLTFYNNRNAITDDLLVLVRFVQVGEERKSAEAIAYRTNNQNAISLRDLNANDSTQVQLKAEFDQLFGEQTIYDIKRGEEIEGKTLNNEYAGQLLLAFNVREPWSSHQKYKVFGDRESEIFAYGVTAAHVRLVQLIAEEIDEMLLKIKNERLRKYSLTKFILLYLIGEILRNERDGKRLLVDPKPFLQVNGHPDSRAPQTAMMGEIKKLANFVVTELNYFVEGRADSDYDYKTEFKSPKHVKELRSEVMKAYDKDKFNKRATPFSLPA